ncbi:hypothetical protein BGP_3214 [Beggiatoa sp. PS]|nr:hypothetical protein BGP_3214 [Beggiatoa sp. PS]
MSPRSNPIEGPQCPLPGFPQIPIAIINTTNYLAVGLRECYQIIPTVISHRNRALERISDGTQAIERIISQNSGFLVSIGDSDDAPGFVISKGLGMVLGIGDSGQQSLLIGISDGCVLGSRDFADLSMFVIGQMRDLLGMIRLPDDMIIGIVSQMSILSFALHLFAEEKKALKLML